MQNVIFLSSISNDNKSGKIYISNEEKITELNYNNNFLVLEKLLCSFIDNNFLVCVTDSKKIFKNLSFIESDILLKINFFDCKLFLSVYKNLLNIDIYHYSFENYNINSFNINEKIKNIWKIQNIKSWKLLPKLIIEDFLKKDIEICKKFYDEFNTIFQQQNSLSAYYKKSLENLYYLVKIENNGIYSKDKKIIPKYHYDRILTGRLVNTYPKSFQVLSKDKFFKEYNSRFENGNILLADWSNTDFRTVIALSNTKITDKNLEDPYVFLAKSVLKKDNIEITERDIFKKKTMSILYGKYYKDEVLYKEYPNIFKLKREKIIEAKKKKYIQSYFGKIRFFNNDEDLDTKAFSSYVQMTVADLFKDAIKNLILVFKENNLQSVPIPYLVYDSFAFDIHPSEKDIIRKYIEEALIIKTIPKNFRECINFGLKYYEK